MGARDQLQPANSMDLDGLRPTWLSGTTNHQAPVYPSFSLGGQKLGREIQPAAAFDEPCSALIVHLAWRTLMARRCGGHRRIRGARAGEPTSMLCPLPQVTRSCWGEKNAPELGSSTAGQLGTMTHGLVHIWSSPACTAVSRAGSCSPPPLCRQKCGLERQGWLVGYHFSITVSNADWGQERSRKGKGLCSVGNRKRPQADSAWTLNLKSRVPFAVPP